MKWLMEQDSLGVERYLYVLLWFFVTVALIGSVIEPIALLMGW